ncbi:MAG: pyridoxamine 5'-phosphate oxidase family protein [Rhodococcus sp.]|nr:pyridoxamine 5'-phosphate oxidase family protein [Rhodococcus sp. (in: high G+C Gram-positive bacteria)]
MTVGVSYGRGPVFAGQRHGRRALGHRPAPTEVSNTVQPRSKRSCEPRTAAAGHSRYRHPPEVVDVERTRIDTLVREKIDTVAQLEAAVGEPSPAMRNKTTAYTTPLIREFIAHARFFVLATADAAGNCDCSPRGDLVSTVLFPDERTLVLADRPGNRRADSYRNILENPHVGILFIVPGNEEVVRVNGTASLTTDPELLDELAMNGRPAQLAMIVRIDEAYLHCARALLRAKLWDPESWPDPSTVPAIRDMLAEQHRLDVTDLEPARQEAYRAHLY